METVQLFFILSVVGIAVVVILIVMKEGYQRIRRWSPDGSITESEKNSNQNVLHNKDIELGDDIEKIYPEQEVQDMIKEVWRTGKPGVWHRSE